jgi:hypothetical protein
VDVVLCTSISTNGKWVQTLFPDIGTWWIDRRLTGTPRKPEPSVGGKDRKFIIKASILENDEDLQ